MNGSYGFRGRILDEPFPQLFYLARTDSTGKMRGLITPGENMLK